MPDGDPLFGSYGGPGDLGRVARAFRKLEYSG